MEWYKSCNTTRHMTSEQVGAINLGSALRDGLQLKTVEVVALLHNACSQVDAGSAAALPRSIDDLWVTSGGAVVLPRMARVEPIRTTVAALLEALLPESSEDAAPAALRTLPARLRESVEGSRTSEVKDLLTILRWHLPAESSAVLHDLVTRVQLVSAQPPPDTAIELFADEGDAPSPAALPVAAPQRSAHARRPAIAAAVLLALGAAGYAGYQFNGTGAEIADTPAEEMPPANPVAGRITRAALEEPAPAAAPRRDSSARPLELAVNGGAFSPTFTSDGASLIFHAGQDTAGKLFQASLNERGEASALVPLLDERGRTYHARLSPDGIWVAFDSDRDGERGVYLASRNGRHVARVSGEGFAAVPSWSPDMKWLAFVRAEPGRPKVWNLWLRNVETGELARQSAFRAGQVWGASWFPGSRSIAYSHEDQLLIRDTATGTSRRFASPIAGRMVRTPAVSPDGKKIVFQVYRDGAWLLDLKNGAMRRLLTDPTAEEFAWDPDGSQIAYHSRRDGVWRIWLLSL